MVLFALMPCLQMPVDACCTALEVPIIGHNRTASVWAGLHRLATLVTAAGVSIGGIEGVALQHSHDAAPCESRQAQHASAL